MTHSDDARRQSEALRGHGSALKAAIPRISAGLELHAALTEVVEGLPGTVACYRTLVGPKPV